MLPFAQVFTRVCVFGRPEPSRYVNPEWVRIPTILLAQNPNPSPELDAYILDEMDYENLPGMSTLIVKGGEIVWVESYGMADIENDVPVSDNTAFLMASVSKLFMATALMQLAEVGQIDLDEDINT